MKKNMDFLSLHPALADWLCEKLKNAPPHLAESNELLAALEELRMGKSHTLMLEIDGELKTEMPKEDVMTFGALSIFPKARKVLQNNREISLTPKEFDILYFLARNRGEVFTKEQIYQAVWDSEYLMDDSNIMAFIRKLRKKIETNPGDPEYILTIWGIGYKFNETI